MLSKAQKKTNLVGNENNVNLETAKCSGDNGLWQNFQDENPKIYFDISDQNDSRLPEKQVYIDSEKLKSGQVPDSNNGQEHLLNVQDSEIGRQFATQIIEGILIEVEKRSEEKENLETIPFVQYPGDEYQVKEEEPIDPYQLGPQLQVSNVAESQVSNVAESQVSNVAESQVSNPVTPVLKEVEQENETYFNLQSGTYSTGLFDNDVTQI